MALNLIGRDRRVKKTRKGVRHMADPVWLARILSTQVNSQDDDGVLVGNWSGDYADGKTPGTWVGSVNILQEYARTGEPVKYGQCWVFSGVMTTLLRALGIPARSVTNFESAHDTDGTMTIDEYVATDQTDLVHFPSDDSVWNFHVWNEVWLRGTGSDINFSILEYICLQEKVAYLYYAIFLSQSMNPISNTFSDWLIMIL